MIASPSSRRTTHRYSEGLRPAGSSVVSHVVAADGKRIPSDSLEQIERLDDTVFAALSGDAIALERAAQAWREAQRSVDPQLLDEARQHYVSRARSRWRSSQRQPEQAIPVGFAALELLDLLDERAA